MDKQNDFEKGWEEYKAKQKKEIKEMIGIIQNAVGCEERWAKWIAEELHKNHYRKIPENAMVLTREALNDLEYKAYARGVNSFNTLHEKQLSKARKEMAEKFANDISGDILVVNTKEYGRIEVVPLERIDEICKEIIGEKET